MVRNTRANVLALLKEEAKCTWDCADCALTDEESRRFRQEAMTIESAIKYLTDNEYFQDIWKIYMGK